jgi:hypothetical protein
MQQSFTLATQIESIILDTVEGKLDNVDAFTAVAKHFGSDLNADELKLNSPMLRGIGPMHC